MRARSPLPAWTGASSAQKGAVGKAFFEQCPPLAFEGMNAISLCVSEKPARPAARNASLQEEALFPRLQEAFHACSFPILIVAAEAERPLGQEQLGSGHRRGGPDPAPPGFPAGESRLGARSPLQGCREALPDRCVPGRPASAAFRLERRSRQRPAVRRQGRRRGQDARRMLLEACLKVLEAT